MSKTYSNLNDVPITFTRTASGNPNSKPANLSPYAVSKKEFDTVIVEMEGGEIRVIRGIRASVIITNAQVGEYGHILHWPKRLGKRKAADIVVISDEDGKLFLKEGEAAREIIGGNLPKGYEIEFTPPKKRQK